MGANMLLNMMMNTMLQQNPQLQQMMSSFKQFQQQITPAQAETQVKELLSSGQMTQEQFENLKQMAQQYSNYLS